MSPRTKKKKKLILSTVQTFIDSKPQTTFYFQARILPEVATV